MRQIGHLESEPAARRFQDYLLTEGIASRLEFQQGTGWIVWVEEEDKLNEAAERLNHFRTNPSAPEFQGRANRAEELRLQQRKDQAAYQKRQLDRRHLFRPLAAYGFGLVSSVLIVMSVLVFFWSHFGTQVERVMPLFITSFWEDGSYVHWMRHLNELRHGQVWRLVTPMFIHFTFLHILFNMLWLRDLGSMIEARQSSLHLALLVVIISAVSNLAQFYLGHSPVFGGMSGVVYGLLGYIWIRGKFDPASGLFLHPTTVTTSLIWFVVCWAGFLPIANYAHTAGLLLGMAWGWVSSLRYR
jgi:GlpG protein